jgi:UDP-N-acetylmuramoyl-tripeptide--D-alanyl-D-alanine ligase
MTPMTLHHIAAVLGCSSSDVPERTVHRVCTDTRQLRPGDLFVALRGNTFDANDFLDRAVDAAAAIVERVDTAPPNLPVLVVPDARRALGDLALAHRRTLRGRVLAVAGSNGKTGTKLLLDAALSGSLRGSCSPKSFNNDVGVPLTLLAADREDDYVIVEIGTNAPGEVARLAEMAEPDLAVITSIGHEHLEGLGDLDGVRRENLAITRGGRTRTLLNADDAELVRLARERVRLTDSVDPEPTGSARGLPNFEENLENSLAPDTFATTDAADITCDLAGTTFTFDNGTWRVPHLGRHAANNAIAAIKLARLCGVADDAIAAGLTTAAAADMRLQASVTDAGVTILNDAYNANPQSVAAALEFLRDIPCDGRRVVVLGDMLELGESARLHHAEAGRAAGEVADLLVAVGKHANLVASSASVEAVTAATAVEAAELVARLAQPGDVVLLKASRGVGLEVVAEALVDASVVMPAAA